LQAGALVRCAAHSQPPTGVPSCPLPRCRRLQGRREQLGPHVGRGGGGLRRPAQLCAPAGCGRRLLPPVQPGEWGREGGGEGSFGSAINGLQRSEGAAGCVAAHSQPGSLGNVFVACSCSAACHPRPPPLFLPPTTPAGILHGSGPGHLASHILRWVPALMGCCLHWPEAAAAVWGHAPVPATKLMHRQLMIAGLLACLPPSPPMPALAVASSYSLPHCRPCPPACSGQHHEAGGCGGLLRPLL
jgi:hypothetical protein